MNKFKIKTNEKTYGEVVDLLLTVGIEVMVPTGKDWIIVELNGTSSSYSNWNGEPPKWFFNVNEVSFDQLRAFVSLHKNPINMDKVLSEVRSDALGLFEDKEYLNKETYEFVRSSSELNDMWIEIPEGAEYMTMPNYYFWKDSDTHFAWSDSERKWNDNCGETMKRYLHGAMSAKIVWQRHTQPEELPFVDDEPSLNDQYAEIEQVRKEYKLKNDMSVDDYIDTLRCEDTVNHPSHYAGEIECIDAIESSMTNEAFCGYLKGNVQKYMWRYEKKGGLESLEKAQWYLNKLISRIG